MSEDRRFDEYFGCGVTRRHSKRPKIAHRECLYPAWITEDRRFDEIFGCGVGRGHWLEHLRKLEHCSWFKKHMYKISGGMSQFFIRGVRREGVMTRGMGMVRLMIFFEI